MHWKRATQAKQSLQSKSLINDPSVSNQIVCTIYSRIAGSRFLQTFVRSGTISRNQAMRISRTLAISNIVVPNIQHRDRIHKRARLQYRESGCRYIRLSLSCLRSKDQSCHKRCPLGYSCFLGYRIDSHRTTGTLSSDKANRTPGRRGLRCPSHSAI